MFSSSENNISDFKKSLGFPFSVKSSSFAKQPFLTCHHLGEGHWMQESSGGSSKRSHLCFKASTPERDSDLLSRKKRSLNFLCILQSCQRQHTVPKLCPRLGHGLGQDLYYCNLPREGKGERLGTREQKARLGPVLSISCCIQDKLLCPIWKRCPGDGLGCVVWADPAVRSHPPSPMSAAGQVTVEVLDLSCGSGC